LKPKLAVIITPCARPQNLSLLEAALEPARELFDLRWLVVHDCLSGPCEIALLRFGEVYHVRCPGSSVGHGQVEFAHGMVREGWVWRFDDDNLPVRSEH